jgi:hypothetical protein
MTLNHARARVNRRASQRHAAACKIAPVVT